MTNLKQLNREFLIEQLKRAMYAHTSVIRYLRTHKSTSIQERIELRHDIKRYRYIAEGVIHSLRGLG